MYKLAFIFPGQGSQYAGMGKDLYDNFELIHRLYERADEIVGYRLSKISFEGPEELLKQTQHAQPAIFLHSVATLKLLEEFDLCPSFVAGHSLGEYSALVAANSLSFEDGLRLVSIRGQLTQKEGQINPGSMAAILGLGGEIVGEICEEASSTGIVVPANFNSSEQIVISGEVSAVRKAVELAKARRAKRAIELQVSAAFHSPLMKGAVPGMKEVLVEAEITQAKIPLVANVTGKCVTEPDQIKDLLAKQITSPVKWTDSMQTMIDLGVSKMIEIGPGKVLQGLMKRIDESVTVVSVGDVGSIESLKTERE